MQYLLAFLAIIVLIIVHEAGHFLVARFCKMKVERFSIFFGRPIAKFTRGGTVFQIGTIPLGGFVQITGMNPLEDLDASDPHIYPNRPAWQRLLTIFAGPGANYVAAAVIMLGLYMVAGVPRPSQQQEVVQVMADAPASKAGVRAGDILLAVGGEKVTLDHPAHEIIDRSGGKPLKVELLREGQHKEVTLQPAQNDGHYRIGVQLYPVVEYRNEGLGVAIAEAVAFPINQSRNIVKSLGDMVRGKQKAEVSGPIGIVDQLGKQMKRGPRDSIALIALMSVFLGLFNLLPIPALDGGRLVFLLYEVVSRRRVNQRVEAGIHMVGFVLLFGIMIIASVKDVRRIFAPEPTQTAEPASPSKATPPAKPELSK